MPQPPLNDLGRWSFRVVDILTDLGTTMTPQVVPELSIGMKIRNLCHARVSMACKSGIQYAEFRKSNRVCAESLLGR